MFSGLFIFMLECREMGETRHCLFLFAGIIKVLQAEHPLGENSARQHLRVVGCACNHTPPTFWVSSEGPCFGGKICLCHCMILCCWWCKKSRTIQSTLHYSQHRCTLIFFSPIVVVAVVAVVSDVAQIRRISLDHPFVFQHIVPWPSISLEDQHYEAHHDDCSKSPMILCCWR